MASDDEEFPKLPFAADFFDGPRCGHIGERPIKHDRQRTRVSDLARILNCGQMGEGAFPGAPEQQRNSEMRREPLALELIFIILVQSYYEDAISTHTNEGLTPERQPPTKMFAQGRRMKKVGISLMRKERDRVLNAWTEA